MALAREDRSYAMVLFDLDNFKEANDRYGHMFGDEVLKHVARLVQKSVRGGDIAARIGGDEFLIFLEYSGGIEPVIRRIFDALHGEYQSFEILISMGIALSPGKRHPVRCALPRGRPGAVCGEKGREGPLPLL